MSEKAGIWQRVSTGGQDEASQLPDLARWCEAHSYDIAERYVLHGKSASKGKQDSYLDQVIRDMQDGKISVLVVWASSRIERRGAYNAFDLARRVREAGGRIEYVKDAYLNDANEMSDVMLALAATKDRQKSRDISDQVIAKQAALRAAGSAVGRAPWGYEIVERDGKKIFAPTDAGRNYIPLIFARVTNGESLRDVAAWLTAEQVPTTTGGIWNEGYLASRLIKNPVYYGQRRNSGQLETEGLVSYSAWLEANAALTSRGKPGRDTVVREKAMLSPVCGNPACDATGKHPSPMYRIYGGYGEARQPYYRCTGSGPRRTGCGNMFPLAELDDIVTEAMVGDLFTDHVEQKFIPGNDRSGEIGKLRGQAMDAYASGDKARFLKLDAQADELAAIPSVGPHWESRKTGLSVGEHFDGLDAAGRREYVSHFDVSAHKDADGTPRVVISPREAS
jgi:site-specific DNA recombinase